jgi:hypothetical protein
MKYSPVSPISGLMFLSSNVFGSSKYSLNSLLIGWAVLVRWGKIKCEATERWAEGGVASLFILRRVGFSVHFMLSV